MYNKITAFLRFCCYSHVKVGIEPFIADPFVGFR